jgi:hypothetical protein
MPAIPQPLREAWTALTLGLATIAHGATEPAIQELPAPLLRCTELARDAERLQCYDRVIELLSSGQSDKAAAIRTEEFFGIGSDRAATASGRSDTEQESLQAVVRAVTTDPTGAQLIELDNGQVWRQMDARRVALDEGDPVRIARAALGTFRLIAPNGRFMRVARQR